MSVLDFSSMSKEDLIVNFIVEVSKQGPFVRYDDYKIITNWLQVMEQDVDQILFMLDEIFTDLNKSKVNLKYVDKIMQKKIKLLKNII
jgi:hypothetical protein